MLDTESSCAMKRSGQHWSLTKKGRLFVASDPKKGETSGDHVLCHMLRQHSTLSAQHRFALQSSKDWHLCDRQVSSSDRLINAMGTRWSPLAAAGIRRRKGSPLQPHVVSGRTRFIAI